jgi:hypothetical protein
MKRLLQQITDNKTISRSQYQNMLMRNRGIPFTVKPGELTQNPSTVGLDRVTLELNKFIPPEVEPSTETNHEAVVTFINLCKMIETDTLPMVEQLDASKQFTCVGYDEHDKLIDIERLPLMEALKHKDVLLTRVHHKDEFHVDYEDTMGLDTTSLSNMSDVAEKLEQYILKKGFEPTLQQVVALLISGRFREHVVAIREKVTELMMIPKGNPLLTEENLEKLLSKKHVALIRLVADLH